MNGYRRKAVLLAVAGLFVTGMAVVDAGAPASAASFTERWCSTSPAPCVVSASRNGVALAEGDPVKIEMIPVQNLTDFNYTEFLVNDSTATLDTSDDISVTVNLGTLVPDYTEGYAGRPVVGRKNLGGGNYQVTYSGHPVLLTTGCQDTFPDVCSDTATSQAVTFDAEVHQLKTDRSLVGFDRSQSADDVDGIFLNSTPSGDYLESTWNNSRYLTDGTTKATAQARFRIPYRMLVSDFNIPDPSTMVSSSLVGTVNGAPATYSFTQDVAHNAVFVDISGVTFPPGTARLASALVTNARVIRVKRGTITPSAPTLQKATRVTGTRARVRFLRARARGAHVTGYQARCQSPHHPTIIARGGYPVVVVKGLKHGRHYLCSVRALSKAGPGRWSTRLRV
ncbi:MAG: fibronectin type III domain-containing protein [Marmoricola sp.]